MARRKFGPYRFTLASATQDVQAVVSLVGIDSVSIACEAQPGSTYAGTYAVEISLDAALRWDTAIDTAGSAIAAFAAAGTKRLIPVTDIPLLRIRNSSPSGTSTVAFVIYGEGEDLISGEHVSLSGPSPTLPGFGTFGGGGGGGQGGGSTGGIGSAGSGS